MNFLISLITLSMLAGAVAAVTTLTFMFYDWKERRNEKTNPANRPNYSAS
jgi:hypothetical protein